MLQEEVNHLLSKIERELLSFVSFIKNVEEEYNKLSDSGETSEDHGASKQKQTSSKISVDGKNLAEGTAIVDAFNIVKDVLLRMSNLIDEFASLPTADEKNLVNDNTHLVKYYYAQYVYQIASYLVKTVEEHLSGFSEQLNQLASPLSLNVDGRFESRLQKEIPKVYRSQQQEKLRPHYFKFNYFKPAAVFTQDDKMYKDSSARQCKCTYKHPPKVCSSDSEVSTSEDDEESSEDDRGKRSFHESPKYRVKDHRDAVLNRLDSSLSGLVTVVEELLLQLRNSTYTRHTQTPPVSAPKKQTIGGQTLPFEVGITGHCCSSTCCRCCGPCKDMHKTPRFEARKEYHRKRPPSWGKDMLPMQYAEPFWMKRNPLIVKDNGKLSASAFKTMVEKSGIDMSCQTGDPVCSTPFRIKSTREDSTREETQALQDRKTEIPPKKTLLPRYKDKDNINFPFLHDYKLPMNLNEGRQKEEGKIVSSIKQERRTSTGKLKPRRVPSPIQRQQGIQAQKPPIKLELPSYGNRRVLRGRDMSKSSMEDTDDSSEEDIEVESEENYIKPIRVASRESEMKPVFVRDLKEMICTERRPGDKFGGFCLLPGTKNQTSTAKEANILVDRTETEDEVYKYPRAILFDVKKFSNMLGDKFTNYFRNSLGKNASFLSRMAETAESQLILNLIIDSLEEAMAFYEQTDEIITDEGKLVLPEKSTESESDFDDEIDVDNLVDEVISTQIAQERKDFDMKDRVCNDKKVVKDIECHMKEVKRRTISQACELCLKLIMPIPCELTAETSHDCSEKCFTECSLKGTCFSCWNARERGLTIHQCHETVPSSVLEIRHMDVRGKICVCYLSWNRKTEPDDWRWQKSPFFDPTRVEMQQETTMDKDLVLKVIFGPEGTMVKESLAETQLQIVRDFPNDSQFTTKLSKTTSTEIIKSVSSTWLKTYKKRKLSETGRGSGKEDKPSMSVHQRNTVVKLSRFFDEIHRVGYGKGPPLVLKLRRKSVLHDAYDLLMAPSKIRLNYYRSLRILLIPDPKYEMKPSSTNFNDEDQSDELFEILERRLFSSSEKRLFEHPSEETQCLYPNPESNIHPQWFAFAGTVLALALLHRKRMDMKLPLCLFKCLLDRPVQITDLKEIDPLFYQKLMWIKENDITTRKGKLTFSIKDKVGNQTFENDLMPNGRRIVVTEQNKFRYIDLAVKWKLAERCLTQLKDFRGGFESVLDPCFLSIFSEKELQGLIRCPPEDKLFLVESNSSKSVGEITRRETV